MAKAAVNEKAPEAEKKALIEVVPGGLPAELMGSFQEDAGRGRERVTAQDLAIPFFVILQDNSPQVKRGHPKQVEGAQAGMIMNTLTLELFDELTVIPCYFDKVAIEWQDRDSGGGLVAIHPMETDLWKETAPNPRGHGAPILPKRDNHLLVETAQFYVIGFTKKGRMQSVLPMSSTQLKKSRNWNSQMSNIKLTGSDGRDFTPPTFSHLYKLTTAVETKDQNSWFGWVIELAGPIQKADHYLEAKAFYEAANKGLVSVRANDLSTVGEAASDVQGGGEGAAGQTNKPY